MSASPASNAAEMRECETTDAGKIRLGGAYRLPTPATDAGKIRLGGAYRLPRSA